MKYSTLKKSLIITLINSILFSPLNGNIQKTRNLQELDYIKFSSDSIYYKIKYIKNDITGTGNKLQDVSYKGLCIIKNCPNLCCIGEIDSMICGSEEQCKEFYDNSISTNVALAVILPILFLAIFLIAFHLFNKNSNSKNKALSVILAFSCIFIITIPFVFLYVKMFKPYEESEKHL